MGLDRSLLKRMKMRQLEPELIREVVAFARESGYETAISSGSSLGFLLRIYQSEKVKEERGEKALRKAADLIMRLSFLQQEIMRREHARRKEERKKRIPHMESELELPLGRKTREMLSSIGIDDEKFAQRAVSTIGEEELAERVELVHLTTLGGELTKKVFGEFPETLLIMPIQEFVSELDAMESKKEVIDSWAKANERIPGHWANYNSTPGILLDSYEDIERLLKLQLPESPPKSGKREEIKYRGKPMDPEDFIRVVGSLGFSPMRQTKHGTLMKSEGGGIMCVQKGHRKQEELNPSTIKKKLTEAGVDLDEFERKRRELNL